MSDEELRRVQAPTMFCWGSDDPFLAPASARRSIAVIPHAVLHVVNGGHAPWFEDPALCGSLVVQHLTTTGCGPAL